MTQFIQLTVYGLANGAILALAALGFVLIYKATRVINFAQGELLLVGAYAFYSAFVLLQLPAILAIAVAVIVAAALGVAIERLVLRPLLGEDPIAIIMVTIGLSAVLKAAVGVQSLAEEGGDQISRFTQLPGRQPGDLQHLESQTHCTSP
jgi:branched-chain amino acid transport system permease protein